MNSGPPETYIFDRRKPTYLDYHLQQHKCSASLAQNWDYICVENLSYRAFFKNHNIAKASSENSFPQFINMLKYKLEREGKELIVADKLFPSSKKCSCCGEINHKLLLQDRVWTCPSCGVMHDRDYNAALNLKEYSLSQPQGLRG